MPPPYWDFILQLGYPENAEALLAQFGCPADGGDCDEGFGRMIQASQWVCNTRWSLSGALKDNASEYGYVNYVT